MWLILYDDDNNNNNNIIIEIVQISGREDLKALTSSEINK